MMKKTDTFAAIIIFLVFLTFSGCSDDELNVVSNPAYSQIAVIWVEYCSCGPGGSALGKAVGQLQAQPIPQFESFKLKFGNDSGTYNDWEPWDEEFGLYRFGTENGIAATDYSVVITEVATSLGTIQGQVDLPGAVDTIIVDRDSIDVGEAFEFSWTDAGADFYAVHCSYTYRNSSGSLGSISIDRFTVTNSLLLDSTFFAYNGELLIRPIEPTNGPVPDNGSPGNMSGAGAGYLYYKNMRGTGGSKIIVVGTNWH